MRKVQDGKLKKSLNCSSTVYSVPSGGVTETALKCGRPQQKNKHWQCLWSELLSGNENTMHVYICSMNPYIQTTEKNPLYSHKNELEKTNKILSLNQKQVPA